jgi:pSer/pThr/pTyr-binding forkhead associated (FHA) protein
MPQLIYDPGGLAEQRYPLRAGINTLGRSKESTMIVPHVSVFRRHAESELTGRRALLRDLDSTAAPFSSCRLP